jgi:hypothetical protein
MHRKEMTNAAGTTTKDLVQSNLIKMLQKQNHLFSIQLLYTTVTLRE